MTAASRLDDPSILPEFIATGLRHLEQASCPLNDLSLFSGQLGHVVLYAYAYKLTAEDHHWDHFISVLDKILNKLQQSDSAYLLAQPGLLPNLGYVLQVLHNDGIAHIDLGEETLSQFDELIFQSSLVYLRAQNIDFLYGATGAMHYLGTRAVGSPLVATYLRELIAELVINKIEDDQGIRFYNNHINLANGNTDVNIGLAHGHCGLLLVLLRLLEVGVLQAEITSLANGMVDYLLALQLAPEPERGRISFFPTRYHEEFPHHDVRNYRAYNNRLGWCYGDLNVVQTFYYAHRVLDRPELLAIAHQVGEHTCTRRLAHTTGVDTPYLCHGTASMVLYYRRLYEQHPLLCYRDAHLYWWENTLEQLPTVFQKPTTASENSLLMGLPGLMLVLISEALDEPLAWPQLFLL